MPRLGESRTEVATDLMRCADIVVVSLAGIEAERLIIGTTLPSAEHDEDEARAVAALLCRSPASVGAYLEFAKREAAALLADHVTLVLAIMGALLFQAHIGRRRDRRYRSSGRSDMPRVKDMTGKRCGRLTVIKQAGWYQHPKHGERSATWACRCDCGQAAEVVGWSLRSGHTVSCGCAIGAANKRRRRRVDH